MNNKSTETNTLVEKDRSGEVISGGHLVAKALKNEGVDTIFTLCGGHIIDIYDGCVDEGIRIIDVRHEQVAAHAADGYARQTGKLGCLVTTAGPGAEVWLLPASRQISFHAPTRQAPPPRFLLGCAVAAGSAAARPARYAPTTRRRSTRASPARCRPCSPPTSQSVRSRPRPPRTSACRRG